MIHYVYKTTNLINNSIYIGVHSSKFLVDSYLGSGKIIMYAIKLYGRCNFKREILKTFENRLDAYNYEKELVTEDFIKRPNVYNIAIGGRVPKMTKEIKQKISKTLKANHPGRGVLRPNHSEKMKGSKNPMYGKSRKGEFSGSKNGMYGKGTLVMGSKNSAFIGYYITPKGKFDSAFAVLNAHPEIKSTYTVSYRCKISRYPGWSFQPK